MIDDDTTINALALLEGQVLVFVRLLQTMKSEAVLAAAMAHEVADALRLR
ncbi:MAG: M48 family metalloprotease [Nitrospira sp.]|nr:M48 family metalloprotease [Nitrospira sp.]